MYPLINDITTDTVNPPQFRAIAKERSKEDYSYKAEMAEQQTGFYKNLKPLVLSKSPSQVSEVVTQLLKGQGWKFKGSGQEGEVFWFEAIATTSLLRFKDDISIEVRPSTEGSVVHMRSKSRLGRGDFGANAKRIEAFLGQVSAQ